MKSNNRSKIAVFFAFLMTVLIAGVMLSGCGASKDEGKKTEPGTPKITLDYDADNNVIKVVIEEAENADGYKVYMKSEFDTKFESIMTVDEDGSKQRTAEIADVQKNTGYSVKVKAYSKSDDGKNYGDYSNEAMIVTTSGNMPEPTSVAIATVTPEPTATTEPTATPTMAAVEPTATPVAEPTSAPTDTPAASGEVVVTLGQYKGLTLERVSDSDFEEEVYSLLKSNAETKTVNGPAELGDTVNINYAGFMDGVQFEGGTDDSAQGTDLELGSHYFIEGFEEGLVGAMAGEQRDLNIYFPNPYPNNPDLAGKPVLFKVTVNSITRTVLPELNDEFAVRMGYNDLNDFNTAYRAELDNVTFREQIAEQLMYSCTVENVPEDVLQALSDQLFNSYYSYIESLASLYGMDVDTVIGLVMGFSSVAEFRQYCDDYAYGNVTFKYIYKEIIAAENIYPSEEEYNRRLAELVDRYGYNSVDDLYDQNGEETVRDSILADVAMEFVIENAKIVP